MIEHAIEKRRHARVNIPLPRPSEDAPSDSAWIVNLSRGGACVWLENPPPVDQQLALRLQFDGDERVLRSRVVWSELSGGASRRSHPGRARGWVTGLAFIEDDLNVLAADVSPKLFRAGGAKLSLAVDHDDGGALQHAGGPDHPDDAVIALSEQSIPTVKAAARELLPIFARHFGDVRLVVTRQRLEISASFRTPVEKVHVDAPPRKASPRAYHGSRDALRTPAGTQRGPDAPPPEAGKPRRGLLIAGSIAAATVALIGFGAVSGSRTPIPVAAPSAPTIQGLPAWAGDLGTAPLGGWTDIQRRFELPDPAVRAAIRLLRANDKYAPGQRLHDLTRYPEQVGRAFGLMAGAPGDSSQRPWLDPLVADLQARVVQGVRFPDEEPGGRYSSLQQELFNNIVVLAVVELFNRRRGDPDAGAALGGIRGDARALPATAAARGG